jgi:hypothetical protein
VSWNVDVAQEAVSFTRTRNRVLFESLVGTSIEFFDFYAYATAAVLDVRFYPAAVHPRFILNRPHRPKCRRTGELSLPPARRPLRSLRYCDTNGRNG